MFFVSLAVGAVAPANVLSCPAHIPAQITPKTSWLRIFKAASAQFSGGKCFANSLYS
jgi:hypothetical protein